MAIKRERLIHPLFVGLFGGAIGLSGAFLMTHEGLVQRVKNEPPNALSVAYLEAWIHIRRDDMELRALLASQYIRSGRLQEAQSLITELAASGEPGSKQSATQLQMDMIEQQVWALQPDDPQRPVMLAELKRILGEQSQFEWSAPVLRTLAVRAKALDMPAVSTKFLKRLSQVDPDNVQKWRELSVNPVMANVHYIDAAKDAFEAQKSASTFALQREYFLRGISILESGNLMALAMKEAQERLTPALRQDPQTLRALIRVALAANRPDLASDYAQRLLAAPQTRTSENLSKIDHDVRRPVARVTDYDYGRAGWAYLDGPRGNLLRAQLDDEASRSNGGLPRAGILRVANRSTDAAQKIKAALPAKESAVNGADSVAATEDDYSLAYRVFLAAQNLEKALNVTARALQRNPKDIVWLKRRAVVNEWSGHPEAALQAWLALARLTGSVEAWQAVERLGTGLHDDVSYIEALRHRAGNAGNELLLVDQIVATYERLGDPKKALEFLRTSIANSAHQQELLERYAALAERIGDDSLALETWLRLNRQFGPQPRYACKIAGIYNVKADFGRAMDVLLAAQSRANANDYVYWRALWNMAVRNGRDDIARTAGRRLMTDKDINDDDLRAMIDLWGAYPIDAGRIAEESFRRTGNIISLQEAVYQYSRAKAWVRIGSLLEQLTPKQAEEAAKSSELLLVKAEYLRQIGQNDASLDMLRKAVALQDSAGDVRAAYLWALVDRGNDVELRASLQRWRVDAEEDGRLWGPYAAGYMRLSEENGSMHFFKKESSSKRQDPLWKLTYAEALETFGYPDAAWTLRRQAWLQISQHRETLLGRAENSPAVAGDPVPATMMSVGADEDARVELRSQAASLSQPYAGGDFSRRLLLQILREQNLKHDTAAATTLSELDMFGPENSTPVMAVNDAIAPPRMIAGDVALAWALSNEPYELARQWMAQRYGAQLERPAYAEVAVALAMDDRQELERLIEQNPDRIPLASRIEVNMRLDRWSEAQRLAFAAADGSPHSDELHASVRELGLLNANYLEAGSRKFRQSLLSFTEEDIELGLRWSDRWSLDVQALSRQQHSTSPSALVNVPQHDRSLTAGLGWKDGDTRLLFETGSRQAVKNLTSMRVEAAWHQQRALNWTATLGYNQEATDTAELRVGGVSDNASLAAQWRVGKREFVGARVDAHRYYDQDRRAIGSGNQIELEAGYNLRLEYPDFTIRGVFTKASYKSVSGDAGPIFSRLSPQGAVANADIMPDDFTQKGVLFSFGTDLMKTYTHAWRPFMEVGYLHDSINGWNSTGRVGMAGSVFGNDHAVLYYAHERSVQHIDGGAPTTEIGLRYRWYF